MMFFKLGWRNLFRNKRRSFLTSLIVGLGMASLILMDGFWLGMIDNMVKSVTTTYLGHVQIHHPKFQENLEGQYTLSDYQKLLDKIKSNPKIVAYTGRTISTGMLSSSTESINAQLLGIDPEEEKEMSHFAQRIVSGHFLRSPNDLVIGERMRKKLGIELGDRLVLTLNNLERGEIVQELFRLSGVFLQGSKEMDEGMILLERNKLQHLMGISGVHELAFKYQNLDDLKKDHTFLESLKSPSHKVERWDELIPTIMAAINMSDASVAILSLVLFSLVGLGILNTIFMGLFERSYELGVLQAIGTKKRDLLKMILSESFVLGLLSIFCGLLISLIFGAWMSTHGIDYSGIEFGEMTFTEKIYFVFALKQVIFYPLVTLVFTVFVSLYPAWRILKIPIASSLKKSM